MAHALAPKIVESVNAYVSLLRKEIPIAAVYVFGSHAKDSAHEDSDIDVAVISPSFGSDPVRDGSWLQNKLWDAPSKNIDVIGYSPAFFEHENSPLIHEIKKSGIVLVS